MSELITQQIFTDGQLNINASDMNGIIGKATVQPDIIAAKPASATMDIADLFLVLKTDNTLAKSRFDTIVNSTSSALPLSDTTKNGMLRQGSGNVTDYVGGDNQCHPISSFLPPGVVVDFAGPNIPAGWLYCDGTSKLRATYPGLFTAIGTTYGSVDGTHFNVPDFRGRLLAGSGGSFGTLAATGGASTVALAITHLPSHNHPVTDTHTHTVPLHGHTATDSGHTHAYTNSSGTTIGVQGGASQIAYPSGQISTGSGNAQITVSNQPAFNTGNNNSAISTQAVGNGTAFSILPPFQVTHKMIKT